MLFNCDYNEGAHPQIMEMLQSTNFEQTVGYGEDHYCTKARELIKAACGREDVDVHFLVGGTQANLTVISAALRPHQGAVSAHTGHINVHESGAIEATGHKVITLPAGRDGKLSAAAVEQLYLSHVNDSTFEHMVQPKLVYISDSTENGAVYKKAELAELSRVCKKHGLYLYLDGARLGYALGSPENDISLSDLCLYCDAFYIGGTKLGTLFGEAVVLVNPELKKDFRYLIKQKGGMFAKGRLLGIQFLCMFEGGLYFEIGRRAVENAYYIAEKLVEMGVEFLAPPQSNQIFPIFENSLIKKLDEQYLTAFWEKVDESRSAVRICTSWATSREDCIKLTDFIEQLLKA